jgi:MFS transporter, PAT family, beta-lactamase induction signal transducer AmpG
VIPPKSLRSAIIEPFKEFMQRQYYIPILLFIVFYKMGDDFATALLSYFYIKVLHFSLIDLGVVYKFVGFIATIIGVILGGAIVFKAGLYRSLWYFGIFQALATLVFLVLALVGKSYSLLVLSVCAESLSAGLGTSACLAFIMLLCHARYTATQFALLSALFAIARIICGPIAGVMVHETGWPVYFAFSFFMALPGLALLLYLRKRISFNEKC